MAFNQEKLKQALEDLAEPVQLAVLYSHVATVDPEPPNSPEELLDEVKAVLNAAVSEGTVLKARNGYFLAPTWEADMAEEDKNIFDEEEAEIVFDEEEAEIVAEVGEQLAKQALLELEKLEQQPHIEKRSRKRKPYQKSAAELANADKRCRKDAERATDGESKKDGLEPRVRR